MRLMEHNRLAGSEVSAAVRESLQTVLATLESEMKNVEGKIREHIGRHPDLRRQVDLLESTPGIGAATAAVLLADSGPWRGKCKMAILGAAMRKLLHLAFGVLKSGNPFDPAVAILATP